MPQEVGNGVGKRNIGQKFNSAQKGKDEDSHPEINSEKKDWRYFWRRVINDITNKDLIPVKILFFFKYATLFVLYPFLTLHMAELGLDEWEIGINQATAPVVAILGPPFVGIVADKIGNFKLLLSFLTLVNAGMALLLLLVPKARETIILPNYLSFELSCSSSDHQFILQSIEDSTCSVNYNGSKSFNVPSNSQNLSQASWTNLPVGVMQCGTVCLSKGSNSTKNLQPFQRFADLKYTQDLAMELPDGKHFIFSNLSPILACTQNAQSLQKCSLDFRNFTEINDKDITQNSLQVSTLEITNPNDHEETNSTETFSLSRNVNLADLKLNIVSKFTLNGQSYDKPICDPLGNTESDDDCRTNCYVQYDREIFCTNKEERKVYNVGLTFGIYTLFRLLLGFASATSFVMFEGAVLAIMKQYGGDYGLQRVSATLAAIIAAPLSGTLLNAFGFRPVICLYAGLKAFSAFVTLAIDLEFKKPAEKVIRNLRDVLSKAEILIFFFAMLWSGTAWGYLETFLFLYLQRMGASSLLMGLTISVGGIAGLPLLIFSRPIIKRIGHVNCLCLGLLFYGFRYFGYSIITDPWQCLIFEALEAVTVSLAITAASTYAVALSNLQTIASIQGIFGCLYFGIGRGAGSFIGGILIKKVGHIETFRIFGLGSLIGAILYFLVNILYLRKHSMAHVGLDINNLNLESRDTNENKNKKSDPEAQKQSKDNEAAQQNKAQADGGYIGPLVVNKFTDIPLDEDPR